MGDRIVQETTEEPWATTDCEGREGGIRRNLHMTS